VSLELTLFLDFLQLFVEMHLAASFTGKKIVFFGPMDPKVMDVWSFEEKSGQGGPILEPMKKSWSHVEKFGGKEVGKRG
jgi:hypothetical protein